LNVLGISGSPRKNANNHILLEHAVEPFTEAGRDTQVLRQARTLGSNVLAVAAALGASGQKES